MLLEELKSGLRVDGLIPAQAVTVIAAQWHGTDALELTYKAANGALGQQVVFRKDEEKLTIAQTGALAASLVALMIFAGAARPRWPKLRDVAAIILGNAAMIAAIAPWREHDPGLATLTDGARDPVEHVRPRRQHQQQAGRSKNQQIMGWNHQAVRVCKVWR